MYIAKISPFAFSFSIWLNVSNRSHVSIKPSALTFAGINTTLLLAFLNSGLTTLSSLFVVTAKETSVGGTSMFSNEPLIESLPPIAESLSCL